MKKKVACLLIAALVAMVNLKAQVIVLSESFENGIPAGWTQENVVGDQAWATETAPKDALAYPDGAVSGLGRAALRNTTGESKGYKTRLISPVMNLDTVFQPILRYYHAQAKWTADFDTLRVYYRNVIPEAGKDAGWRLLQEFTRPIQAWTKEMVDLPRVSATYQICFEGSENLGRGIVLDSIIVRSKPECTTPHDMTVTNMHKSRVTLNWLASFDAVNFQIVLAKADTEFDIDTLDLAAAKKSGLILRDTTVSGFETSVNLNNLAGNTTYTAFVRSICEVENSDWGVDTFYMKAIETVPYHTNFDVAKTSSVTQDRDWTYGTNLTIKTPYINSNQTESTAKNHARTGYALCFAGKTTPGSGADIAANSYAYAATPMLEVADISKCQVCFWASLGTHGCLTTGARAIVVGVMDDPEDITTFVAVDTVRLWRYATYEQQIVNLASYKGEGRYVAFMSRFDVPNQFFVDDITIEETPAVPTITSIQAAPAVTEATLTWENVASEYKVLVATVAEDTVENINAADIVVSPVSVTTNTYTATKLESGSTYYAYVQSKDGAWSAPKAFTTSWARTLPMMFGFEVAETYKEGSTAYPTHVAVFATDKDANRPKIQTGKYYHLGKQALSCQPEAGRDAWIVFPYIDTTITDVELSFYLRAYSTSYKNTAVAVGVMTDPSDINTFVEVARFASAVATYAECYTDFQSYTGDGKYIAIRWAINPAGGASSSYSLKSYAIIDDVTIKELSSCVTPKVSFTDITPHKATIQWEARNMTKFDILIDSVNTKSNEQLNIAFQAVANKKESVGILYHATVENANTYTLEDDTIRWGRTVYVYVRSVCDDGQYSYWSKAATLTLGVPDAIELPYTENFDYWGTGAGTMAAGWDVISNDAFPYMNTSKTSTKPVVTYIYASLQSDVPGRAGRLVAPVLDVEDLNKLKISFKAWHEDNYSGYDSLRIGVLSGPADSTGVITWMDTIGIPKTGKFDQYALSFHNWTASMGNRVVFQLYFSGTAKKKVRLDDITFEHMVNIAPFAFETSDATENQITISWQGESERGWSRILATKELNPAKMTKTDSATIVICDTITTNPVTIKNLTPQTGYYLYLRALDGTTWSEGFNFYTSCVKLDPKAAYYKMDFEGVVKKTTSDITKYKDSSFPECWTRHGGDEAYNDPSYTPFIYQYKKGTTIKDDSYVHGGLASAYIYANSTAGGPAWFTTQELDAKMANVIISFWAKNGETNANPLLIGVMKNPDDWSTFTQLMEYKPTHKYWAQVECNLGDNGYRDGMGNYIVFATPATFTSGASRYYVDDIEITESACKSPYPVLSGLSTTSVRLAYASEQVDMRMLVMTDSTFISDSLNAADNANYLAKVKAYPTFVKDSIILQQVGIPLFNLKGNTPYSVALQTQCEDGASKWVVTSFHTLCPYKTISEMGTITFEGDGFDAVESAASSDAHMIDTLGCWITGKKGDLNLLYVPYVGEGDAAPAGKAFLRFRTGSKADANGGYVIMPGIEVEDISQLQMQFLGRALSGFSYSSKPSLELLDMNKVAGSIIVGVISDPSDVGSFVAVDTITFEDNAVHTAIVRFDKYKGSDGVKGKHVMFLSEFDKDNYFLIDDIRFEVIPACAQPVAIKVTDVDASSANVSWQGNGAKYRVMVTTEKLADNKLDNYKSYTTSDTVTTPSCQITKLAGARTYYVYVKSLCGDEGTWCLEGVRFKTTCSAVMPSLYVEDFDDYVDNAVPDCWTAFFNGTVNTRPKTYYRAAYDGSTNGLSWEIPNKNAKDYAVPEKRPTAATMPVADISKVSVSFKLASAAKNTKPNAILLGYATDVSCLDSLLKTVQYVDTVYTPNGSTEWLEYNRNMEDCAGKNVHIVMAFYFSGGYYYEMYMDDFMVEVNPTCFAPRGAKVDAIGTDTAVVTIVPYALTDNLWDIMCVSTDGTDTVLVSAMDTICVVKGLKHSTTYNLYVRTNCGGGDVSAWCRKNVSFRTLYKIREGQFYGFETKEGVETKSHILNGRSESYIIHPSLYAYGSVGRFMPTQLTDKDAARTGSGVMRLMVNNEYGKNAYMALPEIEGADALQLRFDMRVMDPITEDSALYESGTTYPYTTLEIGTIDRNYNWDSYKPVYSYMPSQYEFAERITNKKNKLYDQIVVPLPADLDGKYLVINNPVENYSEVYLDNLRLEKKQGYQTPVINQSSITPTSLTIGWDANGSNEWNVYLTNSVDAFPVDSALEANIVKKANVTTNTYTFTDLMPNTKYYAYVQVANVGGLGAASVRRIFRTPLEKMAADTVITFEGTYGKDLVVRFDSTLMLDKSYLTRRAGDSIYVMPIGWYAGNDATSGRLYTPWVRPNNYDATGTGEDNSVRVAFQGERALQLYNSVNSRLGAYAAMPEIDADYDTLQVNFYARPFHEEDGEISDMHDAPLIFGTMTDPNQSNTFVGLDTLYFSHPEYEDGQDATKLQDNGWQKMSTRLTGATGRYAAFAFPTKGDAWYIDNISFSEHTCLAPNGLKALDVTAHTAQIYWRPYDKGVPCVLQVAKSGNFGSKDIILSDTLTTETTKLLTGLLGTTTYYYRLRQICGATDMSPWSAVKSFTTECSEIDGTYSTGFEKEEEHMKEGYDDYYTQCWFRGSTGIGNVYGAPPTLVESESEELSSTYKYWYSRNTSETLTDKWAWKLEGSAQTNLTDTTYNYDQWIAMPPLQHVDVDTLQLVFYALPGSYDPKESKIHDSYCGAIYLRTVIVGVMSDPNDLSTFTPLDTCVYTRDSLTSNTVANVANEFMFQRFEVPLRNMKGHGEHIAFRTNTVDWVKTHQGTKLSFVRTQIHIDDISFTKLNDCPTPTGLAVSDVTLNEAKLSWTGTEGAQWILNVSTDPTFSNFASTVIKDSVVSSMEVVISGLQPVTTYYWNVKQMCTTAMISAESQTARFSTLHQPMYNEFFLDDVKTPFEWERSEMSAAAIFAGGAMVKDNSTPYEFDSWLRNANTNNVGMEGPHMVAPLTNCSDSVPLPNKTYNVKRQAWLLSPNIALGSENNAWLTFNVAMTYYYKDKAAEQTGWDDQFMVVISDDGGKTWKRENATIWNNETTNNSADEHYVYGKGDYVLNDLPAKASTDEPAFIDLSKYKGKTIKVGFYVESTVFNAHNCLRLGNVHINYYNQLTETQSTCQFTDVESQDGRFFIDGDKAQVGEMTFNKFQLASESDAENIITPFDTLYTFKVTYIEAPQTTINKTICEGEEAGAEWGFANRSVSGTYKRKLQSAVTGCDSITTLNLTVIPRQYSTETVTICSGTSYTFNGVEYSKTCVHIDTLTSVITGCDSITKLELTVNPPITAKVNVYTCTGAPYYFTERYPALTLSGTYMDTVRTAEGCDSIVTLTLTVSDVINIAVYDTICQGESFTFEGKQYSETGTYPAQFQSAAGCDSVRTLYLTVAPLYKDTIHASICQGGIYSENGFEATEAGWYTNTKTSIFGCDSITILDLVVTDLDTIRVDTLIQVADLPYFYPNTQITYPLSTEPGVYTDTISVKGKDYQCDYILIHRLTVEGGQGVNDNVIGSVSLQPNVIRVGETVMATGNFAGSTVTVDVYDMVGHCIKHEQVRNDHAIHISGFNVAGLYTVRITDEQGNPFIGRVFVK